VHVLRIEHPTADYDAWKAAFDSDPVDRSGKGVRRHVVLRPEDDPAFVCVEVAFDTAAEAEVLLAAMREVWERVAGTVVFDPQARIFEVAEDRSY
jgi:hypothetical protein